MTPSEARAKKRSLPNILGGALFYVLWRFALYVGGYWALVQLDASRSAVFFGGALTGILISTIQLGRTRSE